MKVTEILVESRMGELHSEFADVYHKLAPKIQRHKDAAGAEQLYQALKAVAVENNAVAIFKDMLNAARNAAHMDYDTNPGGFENWFWYLPFDDDDLSEGSSDIRKKISKFEELALAANRAGDDEKCKFYQQKIQTLKQKMSQGVTEAKFTSQFKTKQEAVQYAKEKAQVQRDPEDGIEIWAMPDSGFNVVHTMNYSGRESIMALGGRKLGTVGPRWPGVAEGIDPYRLERLDPQTRRVLTRMADHKEPGSWLSASEAYAMSLGLQYKNRDPRGWEQEVQHFVDLYRQYSGQGVAEGLPQTLRKIVPGYAKREIDKKMDAQKFGRTDVDKDANYYRYKKIQDKLKGQGVAEGTEPTEQTMNQNISDLVKDAMGARPTSDWMQRWMAMSVDKKLALYQQLVSQLD